MLILGASGDLAERLLLPGVGSLLAGGDPADARLLDGLKIVGTGRSEHSTDDWRSTIRSSFDGIHASGDAADAIIDAPEDVVADPTSTDHWRGLPAAVEGDLVVYFALPPTVVQKVAGVLKDLDLPEHTVLALEKPFGN